MSVRLIAGQHEILEAESADIVDVPPDDGEPRQWQWGASELLVGLVEVIEIEMGIAQRVDERAGLQPGDMGDHVGQERIGGDVEGNTEEDIARALVELAGEPAIRDIKLEQAMAGGQRHAADIG